MGRSSGNGFEWLKEWVEKVDPFIGPSMDEQGNWGVAVGLPTIGSVAAHGGALPFVDGPGSSETPVGELPVFSPAGYTSTRSYEAGWQGGDSVVAGGRSFDLSTRTLEQSESEEVSGR